MRIADRLRSWFRGIFGLARVQSEMETELEFHLETRAEELMREGVPREEALRLARLEFGGVERTKEECLEARGASFFDNLIQDLRYGVRAMRRAPGFTAMAVLVLGLGIGANTAIFSVVNAVLLRPLPYEQPDRLVNLWHAPPQSSFPGVAEFVVSPANFLDWRSQAQSFEGMAAYGRGGYTLTGNGNPETIRMIAVTDGMFSILGARPILGRGFVSGEDRPGREHVVVLSNGIWRSRFGANPEIAGKTIMLNSQAYTVIGVMGADFDFPITNDPSSRTQMWTPLAWTDQERATRGNHNYAVAARLKPGVTVKQAQGELAAISNRLAEQYPETNKGWGSIAVPMREDLVGDVRPALLILLGAVVLVLLIACANIANLVLVKALTRRKEQAVRVALGASRRRLLQQALAETLLLAFAGGVVGLIFAHYGVILIVKFLAQRLPRASEIGLDGWVLGFTVVVSLAAGFAAGLLPAFRASRADVNDALKQGLGRATSDSGGSRTRDLLVVSEVALSLMLLIGAGLLIRSLWMLHQVNPGFEAAHVVTMEISVPSNKFTDMQQQIGYFGRVLDRVRILPGVQATGLIDSLPLTDDGSIQPIAVAGRPAVPMADMPEVDVRVISPGYLGAMHLPLLEGRDLDDTDVAGRPDAVLISDSMAKQFWPNEDAIGKQLTLYFFPEHTRVVVGVVGDVKLYAVNETRGKATLYFPAAQFTVPRGETFRSFGMKLAFRTTLPPANMASTAALAIHEVDPEIPVQKVRTMDEMIAASLSEERFTMLLLGAFAGLALLLAVVGICSVTSYSVSRRTNEVGIRIALGASRMDVMILVVRHGVILALVGLTIGAGGALLLSRVMRSQLFGVQPTDPITFLGGAGVLMVVVLVASYIPARRAMRVDPMVALRYE
jgi:putative ABC transport system permease protein